MPSRDRRRPFWSKWVWRDWTAKTRDLSPEEYTAYHRLLGYAADESPDMCSIPDDDRRLARAAGLGLKAWRRVRQRVLDYWFLRGDCRYEHNRLRADSTAFTKVVENNRSRVNRALQERTTKGQPDVPEARSKKLEAREIHESTPTPPPQSRRAGKPPSGRIPAEGSPILPTNTNGEWQPTKEEITAWTQAYPALDVVGTIREAQAWLVANPTRRKTFNGMARFVNGWLAREQNRL